MQKEELIRVLKELGYNFTREQIRHIMGIVDVNGDGQLEYATLPLYAAVKCSRGSGSGIAASTAQLTA
jgi:hypothetical protein